MCRCIGPVCECAYEREQAIGHGEMCATTYDMDCDSMPGCDQLKSKADGPALGALDGTSKSGQAPLACAFCYTPRWNDESVRWLPVYGPNRLPYCTAPCAPYIESQTKIKRNGGLEVFAALHNKDVEWFA